MAATPDAKPRTGPGVLTGSGARVLLIGTGQHRAGAQLASLPSVAATITDLAAALIECGHADPERVRMLPDPASPVEFGDALHEAAAQAQDALLVCFVGHGLPDADGALYLATAATDHVRDRLEFTAFPYGTVLRELDRSPARQRIVLLDCCFSGLPGPLPTSYVLNGLVSTRTSGGFVLASATPEELALAPPDRSHTVFCGELIRLLREGDPYGPPQLTLAHVYRCLERTLTDQHLPRPRGYATDRAGDLVLAPNPAWRPRPQPQPPAARDDGVCPYRGLNAYSEAEAGYFFGRETLTGHLLERLAEQLSGVGMLVVVGPSGSGKSSLLRAGLLPALEHTELPGTPGSRAWPRMVITPGAQPLDTLARTLAPLTGGTPDALCTRLATDPAELGSMAKTALSRPLQKTDGAGHAEAGGQRLVLVVDQFEEVFTACQDGHQRRAFLDALHAAANSSMLVVLGLRADFYARAATEPRLVGALQHSQVLVTPMTGEELRAVIEQPAHTDGLQLEPGLAERILQDLGANPTAGDNDGGGSGGLPFLSYALAETWRRRHGDLLTLVGYQATGGIWRAVAQRADHCYDQLTDAQQNLARTMLSRMVHLGQAGAEDTRRQVSRAELPTGEEGERVLASFVEARLISLDQDTVQITHEALLRAWPKLWEWRNTDRAGLLVHRRLTDATNTWLGLGKDAGSVYRGAQLADLRAWLNARGDYAAELSPAEHEFVQASVAAEEAGRELIRRNNRRLRRGITALAVLVVIALVTTGIALWQQQVANVQRAIASSREYAAESLSASDTDVHRSMLLAAAAWQAAPTEEARGAILSAQAEPYQGTLGPMGGRVWNVALSPDGTIAALATYDGTVTLWDTNSHREITQLTGADGYPAVAFSPDGRMLATINYSNQPDKRLRLWDVRTHKLIRSLPQAAWNLAFSADGTRLVTTSGSYIVLWEVATGRLIRYFPTGEPPTYGGIAINHDGSLIASGDGNGSVNLWQAATGQRVAALTGHTSAVTSVNFNRDDSLLASASKDGTVRLWNVAQRRPAGVPVLNPPGGNEFIKQALFSPDGNYVVAAMNRSLTVQWWRVSDGATVGTYRGHTQSVTSIAFSPDGHTLLSGSLDQTAILWKAQTTFLIQPKPVGAVAFSKDGRLLASGSGPTMTVWDPRRRDPVQLLTGGANNASLSFSPDGTTLAAAGSDRMVRLWNVGTGTLTRTFTADVGHMVYTVSFSPDGRTLAETEGPPPAALNSVTPPYLYLVRQWDVASGDELATTTYTVKNASVDPYPGGQIVFSPDSTLLAIPLSTGPVDLRQARTGALAGKLAGHQGFATSVAFSADGSMLASGSSDRTIQLWNVDARQPIGAPLTGHNGVVSGVAFLPDGRTLASVGLDDAALRLWDIPGHAPLAVVTGAGGAFGGMAVQPGTGLIATAGVNDIVGLWSPDPGIAQSAVCSALSGPQPIASQWNAIGRDPSQAPRCGV